MRGLRRRGEGDGFFEHPDRVRLEDVGDEAGRLALVDVVGHAVAGGGDGLDPAAGGDFAKLPALAVGQADVAEQEVERVGRAQPPRVASVEAVATWCPRAASSRETTRMVSA